MGSFNVGCGLSNLSIDEGDGVGFVMLVKPEQYGRGRKVFESTRTQHLYATDLYVPYLPPVYGTYDDYGRIADLQASPVLTVIEDIFARPAQDVINAIGEDRNLYSSYSRIGELYIPAHTLSAINEFSVTPHDAFYALGFTAVPSSAPYDETYRYDSYEVRGRSADNLSLPLEMKRMYWDIVNAETEDLLAESVLALNGLDEVFTTFAYVTNTFPGIAREEWRSVRELQSLHGMFFLSSVLGAVEAPIMADSLFRDTANRLEDDFTKALSDLTSDKLYSPYLHDLQRVMGMRGAVWAKTAPLVGAGLYMSVSHFLTVMAALNRMLMPSFNGEQFGNDAASRVLAEATLDIVEERARH